MSDSVKSNGMSTHETKRSSTEIIAKNESNNVIKTAECCINAVCMGIKSSIKFEVNDNYKITKRMIYSCESRRIEIIESSTFAKNDTIVGSTSTFSHRNIKISNKNEIQTKNINVFLFLMDLQTEAFDIIQVSLPTSNDNGRIKSILTNLILLHTSTSRNNVMINTSAITAQNYTGLCRPLNDMDIISETSCDVDQDIFRIDPNEILVPIPDYSNNHDCSVASQNIIQMHKHIITKILHQMR